MHENLKRFDFAAFQNFFAAAGYKFSKQDILSKIEFVMTDSTFRNDSVTKQICQELKVTTVPKTFITTLTL